MRRDEMRRYLQDERLRRVRKEDDERKEAEAKYAQHDYDRLVEAVDAWLSRYEREPRPVVDVELPEAPGPHLTKGGRLRRLLRACWPFGKRR